MAEAKKSNQIGMRGGRILANLPQQEQLDIIANGFPILMKSAGDLLSASKALAEHPRAAEILKNQALEELAKIIILMDIVRCPPKVRPARIGPMMGWFYNHLARLIYIQTQTGCPADIRELQEYVDRQRKSHYLEGGFGEYIFPNWHVYTRESLLYADLMTVEDGVEPVWQEPYTPAPYPEFSEPSPWRLCEALQNVGALTRQGLDIVSAVWSQTEFKDRQGWPNTRRLTHEMLEELDGAELITEAARSEQLTVLYDSWQLPMYHIDFTRIDVPLADLQAEREANIRAEMGYW